VEEEEARRQEEEQQADRELQSELEKIVHEQKRGQKKVAAEEAYQKERERKKKELEEEMARVAEEERQKENEAATKLQAAQRGLLGRRDTKKRKLKKKQDDFKKEKAVLEARLKKQEEAPDRFEKSFFRRELCIRGNTLNHRERCNYFKTLSLVDRAKILELMEVRQERKDYLLSLDPDARAELLQLLPHEIEMELAIAFTVEDHLARFRVLPVEKWQGYMSGLPIAIQHHIIEDKWGKEERKKYLDALPVQDRYYALGHMSMEHRIEYLLSVPADEVLHIILEIQIALPKEDLAAWRAAGQGVLRDKVHDMSAAERDALLSASPDKSLVLGAMSGADLSRNLTKSSVEDQLAALRDADAEARRAWLDEMLRNDQDQLMQLLLAMPEKERFEYVVGLSAEDAASLLDKMPEDERIACLRSLPIAMQVVVLRQISELNRTAYLRWLGGSWHTDLERKSVGQALMKAMTAAERRAAWEERRAMEEKDATTDLGKQINESEVDKYFLDWEEDEEDEEGDEESGEEEWPLK